MVPSHGIVCVFPRIIVLRIICRFQAAVILSVIALAMSYDIDMKSSSCACEIRGARYRMRSNVLLAKLPQPISSLYSAMNVFPNVVVSCMSSWTCLVVVT